MIPIRTLTIDVIIISVIFFSASCSSIRLEKRRCLPVSDYDVFDTVSVTGTGLKLDKYNYRPRKCIKKSESSVTGGMLTVEFVNPDAVVSGERGPYRDFIRNSIRRAEQYNISGLVPFSVACIISVSGKMNYIIDNTIEMTELAESLLEKDDLEGFYRFCGTQFVDSTLFESDFAFVVSYYMSPEDADYFRGRIIYGRKIGTSDTGVFSIFREIGNKFPVFFSSSGSIDDVFIPVEFPAVSYKGLDSDNFIKKIIKSCLSSTSGRITSLQLKKWMDLPDVNRHMPRRKSYRFTETTNDIIETLSRDIRDFSLFRINIGKYTTADGKERLDNLAKKISWRNFYKCSWCISESANLKPELEKDCRDIFEGVRFFREIEIHNPAINQLSANMKFDGDSLSELRLIDKSTIIGDDVFSESDYRFRDKTLYVKVPEKITPGQTMDVYGNVFSSDCIISESRKFIKNENAGISQINNDCYPVEFRKNDLLKRVFMFWRKFPPGEPYYRGNVEITGFSEELTDDFAITDDAADLARRNLTGFYKKFGTHYVSQVKSRRGIVYYFSGEPEKDNDINVKSYGISLSSIKNENIQVPAEIKGGCFTSTIGKFLNPEMEEPLLHPSTVKDFFSSKENFIKIVKDDSSAIPVEVYLKPWSQYLTGKGIIRFDQTIPAHLVQDEQRRTIEGHMTFTDSNGDFYDGNISNGLKNGYGELKALDGALYKGSWMGDLMHGRGMYRSSDGNVYTGDFMYGYPHGKGENSNISGDLYRGDFYKGLMTGQGEMRYHDGGKYRGEFVNGVPDGYGVMEYPDGRKYDGFFKRGEYQKNR